MGFKSGYSDTKWLHKFKGIYGINKHWLKNILIWVSCWHRVVTFL